MGNLVLIGTESTDPDGTRRLNSLLSEGNPEVVVLGEAKEQKRMSRESSNALTLKSLEAAELKLTGQQKEGALFYINFSFDSLGYERRVCEEYAKRTGKRLEYAGVPTDVATQIEYEAWAFAQMAKSPGFAESFNLLTGSPDSFTLLTSSQRAASRASYDNWMKVGIQTEGYCSRKGQAILRASGQHRLADYYEAGKFPETLDSIVSTLRKESIKGSRVIGVINLSYLFGVKLRLNDLNPAVETLLEVDKAGNN